MIDKIQYLNATNADVKTIVKLWSRIDNAALDRPFGGDLESEKSNRAEDMILHAVSNKLACVLKACSSSDNIIGTISGHTFDRPTFRQSPIGVIYSLWVDENYRNQGIGQELLNRMELFLRSMGAKALQVGWDTSNQNASEWWQKRGYRPYETIAFKSF
jgi:ribosomal protein S18 acetylase RimI-like enzyme